MSTSSKEYVFADFRLSLTRRTLEKGAEDIRLNAREFDTLAFLIDSAPRTLTHDEIIEHVWQGTSVGNNSVEKVIAGLRKALDDDPRSPRFIKTVHGRGYLFIAKVQPGAGDKDATVSSADSEVRNGSLHLPLKIAIALLVIGVIAVGVLNAPALLWRFRETVLLSDDFSGPAIDEERWTVEGKDVWIENGVARLQVHETDSCGRLISEYFHFDRDRPITIKSRVKVSYSRNLKDKVYFTGFFGLQPRTSLEAEDEIIHKLMFGVAYTNYDYESNWPDGTIKEQKAEGFFLTRHGGSPQMKMAYEKGDIGPRIEPVWDKWFEQVMVYDPGSGDLKYSIDGELKSEINVGPLPDDLKWESMRIEIDPRGWWLHHEIDIDDIRVTQ